jgi:predicted esterase
VAASAPKQDHLKFYVVVGVAVVLVIIGIIALARRGGKKAHTGAGGETEEDGELLAWCANGLTPIPGRGCFAEGGQGAERPLIIYLHGMYTPSEAPQELERQARVAKLGTAKGFSVLALRGRQGQCTAENAKDHFCWPSNDRNASDATEVLAAWETALGNAERRTGKGRRYLLGFSNGGYFATLIATRGLLPFEAVAIAGAGPVDTSLPPTKEKRAPLLLLAADEDPSVESMMTLDGVLKNAGWPHTIISRDGGHQLTAADVAHALTFFERTRREPMPLAPPISTRLPKPRLPKSDDAGVLETAPASTSDSTTTATSTTTTSPTVTSTTVTTPPTPSSPTTTDVPTESPAAE